MSLGQVTALPHQELVAWKAFYAVERAWADLFAQAHR
jgi:hypothetical protein